MRSLIRQLNRWRFRERLIRLVWGGARWLAAVAVGLALACAIDWTYDRYEDVPGWFRFGLLSAQAIFAFVLAYLLLLRPWATTPPIDDLASRAEKAIPEFDHRLVTAIQLNRPSARTAGMSPALIAAVTKEAGDLAARHRLTKLIDYSRVGWAVLVVAPIAFFWAAFVLVSPGVATALLKRQAMIDAEIPRSVKLENKTVPLWASGDEVEIRYEVKGRFNDGTKGSVFVTPVGQAEERYPLAFHSVDDQGKGLFTAKVPPSSVNFTFRARLADARTHANGEVAFVPRPAVKDVEAWAILPAYLGLIPTGPQAGQRYEKAQNRGEVLTLPGSSVRVKATFSKPVAKAELILLERIATGGERDGGRRRMRLEADGQTAVETFEFKPELVAYRIEIADEHGFKNLSPPRRGLMHLPDEPPRVVLLQENEKDPNPEVDDAKASLDDFEVNGIPMLPDGQFVVGYNARSPMGIGEVSVHYRVNDEENWQVLPLKPVVADLGKVGPFVPELGMFQKSSIEGNVESYKLPSQHAETEPSELEAGGHYLFKVGGLTKKTSDGRAKLEPGDRVEFFVAATDKAPGGNRPFGRSESRIKAVVTDAQAHEWHQQHDQSRARLKAIEERQRGVFQPAKP